MKYKPHKHSIRSLKILARGIPLAAKLWHSEKSKPKIIALHGWLDNCASFDTLLPLLDKWEVLALDFPGHGKSAHLPKATQYHHIEYPLFVLAAADFLGWKKFSLLGHSLGGGVASLIGASFPERVHKIALIENLGSITAEPELLPERLRTYYEKEKELKTKKRPTYSSIQRAAEVRARASKITLEAAKILAIRGTRKTGKSVTWATDSRLTIQTPSRLTEPQVKAILSQIQCPTLVIQAEGGTIQSLVDQRKSYIPQVKIHRVIGSHHVHLENPDKVAPLLSAFFST